MSEVGERAEGREHSLCDSHLALWYDADWRREQQKWSFSFLFWLLVSFFFFSFFLLFHTSILRSGIIKSNPCSPGRSSQFTVRSELKGRRSKILKMPPFLHSSPAISPSSLLSISVSCESNFKSLFFMQVLTVRRWSVSVSYLAGSFFSLSLNIVHLQSPKKLCYLTTNSATSCSAQKVKLSLCQETLDY